MSLISSRDIFRVPCSIFWIPLGSSLCFSAAAAVIAKEGKKEEARHGQPRAQQNTHTLTPTDHYRGDEKSTKRKERVPTDRLARKATPASKKTVCVTCRDDKTDPWGFSLLLLLLAETDKATISTRTSNAGIRHKILSSHSLSLCLGVIDNSVNQEQEGEEEEEEEEGIVGKTGCLGVTKRTSSSPRPNSSQSLVVCESHINNHKNDNKRQDEVQSIPNLASLGGGRHAWE